MFSIPSIRWLRLPASICAAAAFAPWALQAQTASPANSPGPANSLSARPVLRAAPVNGTPAPAANGAAKPALPGLPAEPGAASPPAAPADPLYQVGPGDVVSVKVYQEDDLLTTARVSKEGTINFPLIGSISIAGRTPEDVGRVIAAELAKQYLVNPQVTVTVTEYALRHFTVLGEVQKPGDYTMPDRNGVTLLEAIGDAGGYTRIADPANIRVKRLESGGKESVIKLNAKSMASERQTVSFEVKPGDIITVGQSFF